MRERGIIKIEIPSTNDFYKSVYKEVLFFDDTGGFYFYYPHDYEKNYFSPDDKRIIKIYPSI